MSKLGGNYDPTKAKVSDAKKIFDELVHFKDASDEELIENMHIYYWMFDLFKDEEYSPKVSEAYEQYQKLRKL